MFRRCSSIRFMLVGLLVVTALGAFSPAPVDADEMLRGSGVARSERRDVGAFRAVALEVPARLTLRQGEQEGVSITGDDNIVPRVETVVENGTLKIRWTRPGDYSVESKVLDIVVDARSIEALAVRGSGRIHVPRLRTAALQAAIDGSGRIGFDTLEAESLAIVIRGNGRVAAAGRAGSLDATISGSGEVEAPKLETRRARVTLNGSAQATVRAQETLNATVAGSGEIKYYGKPRVTQTVAGSGRIRQAAEAS